LTKPLFRGSGSCIKIGAPWKAVSEMVADLPVTNNRICYQGHVSKLLLAIQAVDYQT